MNNIMPAKGGSASGGKIVFFGTANVALPILEALRKEHEILAVVTNPDAPAGRSGKPQESPVSALAADLNLMCLKPKKVKGNAEFLEQLKQLNADIFVVVAYGTIMPLEIISLPKYKSINVHFSALPKYRGPSPMQAALLNGDQQTGVSMFVLDELPDHGPLIDQQIVGIEPDDNYFTLSDKLAKISAKAINQVLADYTSNKITPLPQDDSSASQTHIIAKQDGKIDWNKSAEQIYNQFRAFYLWPGIFTTWKGQNLKITECITAENSQESTAENYGIGTVLEGGFVACGEGKLLKINRLQLAGKNEVSFLEFINGYRDFVGSVLG